MARPIYHGEKNCEGQTKAGNLCTNKAYYKDDDNSLKCGVHSKKETRTPLPKDKNGKARKDALIKTHLDNVIKIANNNLKDGVKGRVRCHKMRMMKDVPLIDGYLNVFPNNKHQTRTDGFGCASLSPMRLGPVDHKEPGLPSAKNIENYHQYRKVYPNEVNEAGDPTFIFYELRKGGYEDPIPHRHKYDSKTMEKLRKEIKGENRNAPLYSIHLTLDGQEKRFTYVESRYFYCKAYETLAKKTNDYAVLRDKLDKGTNMIICGYDAYEVTSDLYKHYTDPKLPFGHELVLYTLLTVDDVDAYPWNEYRRKHKSIYKGCI